MNNATLLRAIPWALAVLVAVWLFDFTGTDDAVPDNSDYELPDDAPDIYITGLDLTRYDATGQATLTTRADTMSVYESTGQSRLSAPIIHRLDDGIKAWQITADQATVYENNNIDLIGNVVIAQQNAIPPMVLHSDRMHYDEQQQQASTEQPVEVTQGKQRISSVGLTVNLDTIDPVIQFLSDVDFYYDPS
ncbi:LPS export ABC transporter periplasmic protein LptC [Reinekea blandensis]|uniref:Lipopolysaccharide export system protein LptC n=1 Tax=Reinekea blandensis MED297 TaxID=314283 RepID=A4BC81_9GAMM|nr:LPS export ABC transporter periplasmic protein LptC [Reinekea blandensis]EAR10147.1 hypothetical protein MED297_13027 [Reinekea sp. MED297] [Reinekea blandensis MED297]